MPKPRWFLPFALIGLLVGGGCKTAADRAIVSVVRITGEQVVEGWGPRQYVCSGMVIAANRVLTAAHCAGKPMFVDGRPAFIIRSDDHYDLLLLTTSTTKPSLTIRARPPTPREHLTALGFLFGWSTPAALPVSVLLVDMPGWSVTTPGLIVLPGYVRGMSGGPVVDRRGQVVGIIQQSQEGLGYGIGSLLMRAFLLGPDS